MLELQPGVDLKHYLLSAVKFKVIDYFRKAIVQEKHQQDFIRLSETERLTLIDEIHELNGFTQKLDTAIELLPEKMQRIIQMYRQEEKSIQQISEELNLSVQTVKNQLTNATKKLRSFLEPGMGLIILFIFR